MRCVTWLAVTLAVLSLAACGAQDDHSVKPHAGQSVEIAADWSAAEQAKFQVALDTFVNRTGATVKYTSGGDDLAGLINSRIAEGTPPDIALISQPSLVAQLVKQGALKPLDPNLVAEVEHFQPKPWRELATIDGTMYGFYFKVVNKSAVWYRADEFSRAGVQLPTTWQHMTDVNKTLVSAGITPMAVPGGDGTTLTDWFENIYLRIAGADMYDKLSKHQIAWTDPTVVQTLDILKDYWSIPNAIQGGRPGAVRLTLNQCIADVFGEKKPKAAMLFAGDLDGAEIDRLGTVGVGYGARIFDWPSVNGSKPAVVTAGHQAVAFTNTEASQALMAFLAHPQSAEIMAPQGGFISPIGDLDQSTYPDDVTRALAASAVKADLVRFDLSDLSPESFGRGTTSVMGNLLQQHLSDPHSDPAVIARHLEAAAVTAYPNTQRGE